MKHQEGYCSRRRGSRLGKLQRQNPGTGWLAAIALLLRLRLGLALCEYGSLPGTMVVSETAPFSLTWTPFDERCQLKDELTRLLGPPPWSFERSQNPHQPYSLWAKDVRTPLVSNMGPQVKGQWDAAPDWAAGSPPIRILIYGDSVDASQILDLCREAEGKTSIQVVPGGYGRNQPACHLSTGVQMVEEFLPGNWPSGPYLDHYGNDDAPQLAIPKGFEHLLASTGNHTPNIVVYNALMWDLGRLQVHNPAEHAQLFLTPAFVDSYMTYLGKWLDVIEEAVPPETLLVYHNTAYPRLKDCRLGLEHAHAPLGQQGHVMQLNAAGRLAVAARPRWRLLDFGQMSEATMIDAAHLRDGLHPNPQFVAQAFNIVLNLYREHFAAHGPPNATG